MAVESLQQRLGGRVRDGDSWDLSDNLRDISSRGVLLRGVSWSGGIALRFKLA